MSVLQGLAGITNTAESSRPQLCLPAHAPWRRKLLLDSGITLTVQDPLSFVPHTPISPERKLGSKWGCVQPG